MWSVQIRSRVSEAVLHLDRQLIGDLHNGAKLFPLLYHKKQSLEDLKLLAAHTILMGNACAPGVISGLEMWTGDNDGKNAARLEPTEIDELKRQSERINSMLAKEFNR